MSFQDKVVLVTGASSGIGAAIAIKFAEDGAKVAIVGRRQDKLNEVASKCANTLILVADVSKDEDAKRVVNETVRHFGKLDILVNNAGIAPRASIEDENAIKVFDEVMSINLRAPVFLTHLAVPHLKETKGNIVNISSIVALRIYSTGIFAYSTSKAALDHFTRSVALELAPSGIRVNTVNPGPVRTEILAANLPERNEAFENAAFEKMKQMTALNNVSDPEEIADLVLFIASDKAKAITGSSYVTDNGSLVKNLI